MFVGVSGWPSVNSIYDDSNKTQRIGNLINGMPVTQRFKVSSSHANKEYRTFRLT